MARARTPTSGRTEHKIVVAIPKVGYSRAELARLRKAFQNVLVTSLEQSLKHKKTKTKVKQQVEIFDVC